jgi:hypothetical protein
MENEFDWIEPITLVLYRFNFWNDNSGGFYVRIGRYGRSGDTFTNRLIANGRVCIFGFDTWISIGARDYLNRLITIRSFW